MKIIVFLKNNEIIGYWDEFEKTICTKTLSLIDEKDVNHEYENALIYIKLNHKDLIFPVIVPFNMTPNLITDDLRADSKVIYDKLMREHWPIKS